MTVQAIPLRVRSGDERKTLRRVELDAGAWQFEYRFSKLQGLWYLNVLGENGTRIACGLALVAGSDILAPYHHLPVPPGRLFVLDTAEAEGDPGLDGFDSRFLLLYAPEGEA